jgi:hypothetical protein
VGLQWGRRPPCSAFFQVLAATRTLSFVSPAGIIAWLGNSTFGGGIHVDRQFSEPQEPAYVSGQVLSRMRRDDAGLRPSAAAQAHMESCTACQELARRLAQAVALLRRAQERTSRNGRLELGH